MLTAGERCDAQDFSAALIHWQDRHGRHDLPWQNTRDAYRVWLSEIMLQQTQVATVIPYYRRFLARFPDVTALAQAPLDAVLELWSGLGYYARARNLHRCAQSVVADHCGRFPQTVPALAELPGIGRSTAAAICAFAFGTRAAILDGNVKRVLARRFLVEGLPGAAPTERVLWELAESLLPQRRIEAYTQALMDLGATLCTRRRPRCDACPLFETCGARRAGRQHELPQVRAKKPLPERQTTLWLLCDGRRVLLERRPPAGIWGGLLTPPEGDGVDAAEMARRHGCLLRETRTLPVLKHSFSHFRLRIETRLCLVEAVAHGVSEDNWRWLDYAAIEGAALPAPIRILLGQAAAQFGAAAR